MPAQIIHDFCRQPIRLKLHFILAAVVAALVLLPTGANAHGFKALVFSKTAAFRHASIPDGIAMIQTLATTNDFTVDVTEDAAAFSDINLAQYAVVVFLSTTGDVLDVTQQAAFERYIRAGGGYVGIHSASDTEYAWPWYGQLVGAYFSGHPAEQTATNLVLDPAHPSTVGLPERWVRFDEWYNFQSNPRGAVHVLATLDEASYSPGGTAMGYDHPIAWCHDFDGGRAWYTGGGHTSESYVEPLFQKHVLGGILWAAGDVAGDAGATIDSNYQKVVLDGATSNPMELKVAPDGRVFYVERGGNLKIWKPDTGSIVLAGQVAVFSQLEDGLLGLALDPGFATNNWVYFYYSPAGATPSQRVSRFTMMNDTLDLASEKVLLIISTQRDECCHSGGSLTFGPEGLLYISAGDNTNPFDSSGYNPIDERPGRSAWDAQKSSANGNDLRGKILRIQPQPDGTYTVPPGNLFPAGTPNTRPEIFVMGCRNPFRISVDAATGWLYWGEVGPDANGDSASRGPEGHDEWNQARAAGNFGWPYFVGNNKAYREYDFATTVSGPSFVASSPTNNSPNNTGPLILPPAQPAWIWYPYDAAPEFPQLGTGSRTAMAGPVYHFDTNGPPARRLPAYFDKTLFVYEWSRNWIKEVKLDANGNILAINPFLPTFTFTRPMDMEMGPDGAIYMIEWGSGFSGNNADAKVIRIDYVGGNRAPVIVASASPDAGSAPLQVQFSSTGTYDPETNALSFQWSFFGDGATNSTLPNPTFTYNINGTYQPQLRVSDSEGNQSIRNFSIVVGNNRPVPLVNLPPNGAFFNWGDRINFTAAVFDVEDGATTNGSISCAQLAMEMLLGHNDHAHGLSQQNGCAGYFLSPPGHGGEGDNIFLILNATYTDNGAAGAPTLSGVATSLLQPRHKEAEHFNHASGVTTYFTADTNGVVDVTGVDAGDWISFTPINFTNITGASFRVAAPGTGGQIQLRLDATNGPLLGSVLIPSTGGAYTNLSTTFTDPGGTHELFLVFTATPGATDLLRLNWIEFAGEGIGIATAPDTNPPVVVIQRPADGASFQVGQTVPIVTFATDNTQVTNVAVYVDNVLRGSSGSAMPSSLLVSGLAAGIHSISVRAADVWGNLATNTATIIFSTGTLPRAPYGGVAHSLPGRIEVEDFDQGGAGVAYFEADALGNQGGQYRSSEQVDIELTSDELGGFYNVGYILNSEWLEYTVNTIGGNYSVSVRASSQVASPGNVLVSLNGQTLGNLAVPPTGGWQAFTNLTVSNVALDYLTNAVLRLTSNGGGGYLHNLNWIDFIALSTNPPPVVPPVVEWTPSLTSAFTEIAATVNTTNRTIIVPRSGDIRFYRLKTAYASRITGVQIGTTNVILQYE